MTANAAFFNRKAQRGVLLNLLSAQPLSANGLTGRHASLPFRRSFRFRPLSVVSSGLWVLGVANFFALWEIF